MRGDAPTHVTEPTDAALVERVQRDLEQTAVLLTHPSSSAGDGGGEVQELPGLVASICRSAAQALAASGSWPELALAQARAAYEASRVAAAEYAKDDEAMAVVAPLSQTRDLLKQVLGALESATATTVPAVEQRDLPRVDPDDLSASVA